MKKIMVAAALLSSIAAPAMAAETLTVPFTTPDGAVTTGTYSGTVRITVSGTGQALGTQFNDAFYLLPGGTLSPGENGYYQLGFGTTTLQAFDQANAAFNYIPTGRPTFNSTGTYSFTLNTGLTTPGQLHFGVTDGQFQDNTGAFTLSVAAVPEPATWAMMLLGFGMIGAGMRYRRKQPARAALA